MITSLSISVVDETTSTSDLARTAIDGGAKSGTVFQAIVQTKGRGRHGRIWHSPKGNLYLSVIFHPSRPQSEWPSVSLVAGLALAETLIPQADRALVTLKWPNDVLVDDRKIAGVLLEVYKGVVIIGIGVNLAEAPDVDKHSWPVTTLADHSSHPVLIDQFRDRLCYCLQDYLNHWDKEGLVPFIAPWTDKAAYLNDDIVLRFDKNKEIKGRLKGINPDGTMQLETDADGVLSVSAGDVTRARPVKIA